MHWDWLAIGLIVGFLVGKAHELARGRWHRRYFERMHDEAMLPLARSRPVIDEFFDQDSTPGPSWEDQLSGKVVTDHGMREAT